MIKASNVEEVAKQLKEFAEANRRKLKNMVAGFSREVALAASANTPKGNLDDMLVEGSRYREYYLDRQDKHGLPIKPGYHSGAWQYSEGSMQFQPMIFSTQEMANNVEGEVDQQYKLGDSFDIAAIGPGFEALEGGSSKIQAPKGIMQPTLDQVQTAIQSDLKKYYDASE